MFNNGVELLDKASLVLGTFLNIEENDVYFLFAGSVVFLNVSNVSEAFAFVTRNLLHDMVRLLCLEHVRREQGIHLLCFKIAFN